MADDKIIKNNIIENLIDTDEQTQAKPDEYDKKGENRREEEKEVVNHLQIYTNYLNAYYNHISKSLLFKNEMQNKIYKLFRNVFYITVAGLIISMVILITVKGTNEFSNVISIMTIGVSLISALLIIPTKISDFVYNKDDDKNIGEIIKNIQNYDINVRIHPFSTNDEENSNNQKEGS